MLIRHALASALMLLPNLAIAQTPAPNSPPKRFVSPWASVTQPPVPIDPLELVLNAEPVQGVEQRAAVLKLLNNAQNLSNVRRGPYDLKTQFKSSEGIWQIEESSPVRSIRRLSVQGPSYSSVNLLLDDVLYGEQPLRAIPLRVAQEHWATFGHFTFFGPRALLRVATGNLNGVQLTCVLGSFRSEGSGPRRWDENEWCIDPQSGFIVTYSPVPGHYILYDYTNAHHLRDITLPGKFTIVESQETALEVEVVSLTEPVNTDKSTYSSAGLIALGVGFPLASGQTWHDMEIPGALAGHPATGGQFVVVRAMIAPDGSVSEPQVLASSAPGLNQRALERAAQPRIMRTLKQQNGATPQSGQTFFITLFVTN